mgnify:FL=1
MTLVNIYSEPFRRDGNISAEGASKLLGRPSLTPLELLLRETLQNSWDASIGAKNDVPSFNIRVRNLNEIEKLKFQSFFSELPPKEANESVNKGLEEFFNKPNQYVLEICDFGTRGLGGPFSASESLSDSESNDFVNFVKNIGSPRDIQLGGGTYGFGKSSLFKMSKCNTILIETLTKNKNKNQNRMIGYALGSEFSSKGKRFTGRHWWGIKSDSLEDPNSVDPLIDDDAKNYAKEMGLMTRHNSTRSGTSLVILDPNLEDLEANNDENQISLIRPEDNDLLCKKLMIRIQEILLWHAWPKFTPREDDKVPMKCTISIFEKTQKLPDPRYLSPFDLLTNSLNKARKKEEEIFSQRPKKLLGYVGVQKFSYELETDQRFRKLLGDESLIPDKLSHFALLRPAELVVKYINRTLEEGQPQWGGVFICNNEPDIEQSFAKSEPPSHDDWNPQSLENNYQRTYVNQALTKIKEKIKILSGINSSGNQEDEDSLNEGDSLAKLAGDLGRSLIGKGFGGSDGSKERKQTSGSGTTKVKFSRLTKPVALGTKLVDEKLVADFSMQLASKKDNMIDINLKSFVKTDEGKEFFAPNGKSPKIIKVLVDNKEQFLEEDKLTFKPDTDNSDIRVSVEIPDYVAVYLNAELLNNE